jgi:hypothetical protein
MDRWRKLSPSIHLFQLYRPDMGHYRKLFHVGFVRVYESECCRGLVVCLLTGASTGACPRESIRSYRSKAVRFDERKWEGPFEPGDPNGPAQ